MMSLEPGMGLTRLSGTDLSVPSTFSMEVHRKDGLRVKATVDVVNGRPVCRALKLTREKGQIDRELLHGLGLATLMREAVSRLGWRDGEPTLEERFSSTSRYDAAVIASDVRRHLTQMPLRGPRQLTDEFLAKVARVYDEALRNRGKTAAAVATLQESEMGVRGLAPEPTARRWIAAARKRGFLEPTTKGRKGSAGLASMAGANSNRRGTAQRENSR